ncbi:MAG: hypothetical protein K4571_04410 [Deltaproteobacteria bacterium]
MKKKDNLRFILILALLFPALGGWMMHLAFHEPAREAANYIPAAAGFLSVFVIPVLFIFRRTISFAYLANGMTVILGTIAMAHFTLVNPPPVWTLKSLFVGTLLADIVLLWGKFAVGKALFDLDAACNQPDAPMRKGRFFRFPNMGFWFVHVVALTVVYMLGNYFWK